MKLLEAQKCINATREELDNSAQVFVKGMNRLNELKIDIDGNIKGTNCTTHRI